MFKGEDKREDLEEIRNESITTDNSIESPDNWDFFGDSDIEGLDDIFDAEDTSEDSEFFELDDLEYDLDSFDENDFDIEDIEFEDDTADISESDLAELNRMLNNIQD